MASKTRYVTGEPIQVRDSKNIMDRIVDGPYIHQRTASDTKGNSAEAGAFDPQEAEDKAIFKLMEQRGGD